MAPPAKSPNVTVAVFARQTERSPRTVRFWCERGFIRSQKSPGGRYAIPRSEIERVNNGEPLPDDESEPDAHPAHAAA